MEINFPYEPTIMSPVLLKVKKEAAGDWFQKDAKVQCVGVLGGLVRVADIRGGIYELPAAWFELATLH